MSLRDFFSFFCNLILFIYFWLRWVFIAVHGLSLVVASGGVTLLFIYLFFLAALGLRCCVWAFSSCCERGLLFVVVRGLLIVVASLAAEHGL